MFNMFLDECTNLIDNIRKLWISTGPREGEGEGGVRKNGGNT